MTVLGIRLALLGGRASLLGLAVTALAVAVGTAVLLFALSVLPALEERAARVAWRSYGPDTVFSDEGRGLYLYPVEDRFRDRPLVSVLVAARTGDAPVPPGIPRVPGDGEAFVSPALADLIATTPAEELGDRVGRVVGEIDGDALASPDELVAVIGSTQVELEALGSSTIAAFPTVVPEVEIPLVGRLIILLAVIGAMTPVAVFVATATRLSAARREQRLAAIRLVGATPAQVARLAAAEALLTTIPGTLLGVLLFFVTRPLVAQIPLDERGWFAESIAPPFVPAVALLVVVPVVGTVAAVVALRRIVISPLGVHRRAAPRSPSRTGLFVLAGSIALLLVSLIVFPASTGDVRLFLPAIAFGGILVGIAMSGPWLTGVLGNVLRRANTASPLLAGRRLVDDPRGSFGAIAGVIMAVFVASAFFSLVRYAEGRATPEAVVMRPGQVFAQLSSATVGRADLEARLARTPGVASVHPIPTVELHGRGVIHTAWLVRCTDMLATADIPEASCSSAPVHSRHDPGEVALGAYEVRPDAVFAGPVPPSARVRLERGTVASIGPPSSPAVARLPDLIVDPDFVGPRASGFPATRLYISTDGSLAAAERVRTTIATAAPGSHVRTAAERSVDSHLFAEIGRIVALGLVGSLALAGCSLAVATTTGLLERRRQFALLRSAGMDVSSLRSVVLLQAAAPLVGVAAVSALLGVVTAQLILRVAGGEAEVPLPDAALYVTLAASLLMAMLVVALSVSPLERLTRPETARLE